MSSPFTDPAVQPTTEMIRDEIGTAVPSWEAVLTLLTDAGVEPTWRHYRDGGWLVKATKGSKTIAWLAIQDGIGRLTFYFAERHRPILTAADGVPDWLRTQIDEVSLTGRLLPVQLKIRDQKDVEAVAAVLAVKLSAK